MGVDSASDPHRFFSSPGWPRTDGWKDGWAGAPWSALRRPLAGVCLGRGCVKRVPVGKCAGDGIGAGVHRMGTGGRVTRRWALAAGPGSGSTEAEKWKPG